jgi:hypothetical protein
MLKNTIIILFLLGITACSSTNRIMEKMSINNNPSVDDMSDKKLQNKSKGDESSWFSNFISNVSRTFETEQKFNGYNFVGLEQTKECNNLIVEMGMDESFAKTLGVTAKVTSIDLINRIGDAVQGKSNNNPNDSKKVIELFAKGLIWLPMEIENYIGDLQHSKESNILSRDDKLGKKYYKIADDILLDLIKNLPKDLPYNFKDKLYIIKTKSLNAKAMQGGYIYVDEGLFRDPVNTNRIYFALSHEVAHLLQRHETKHAQAKILDGITTLRNLSEAIKTYSGALDKMKATAIAALNFKEIYTKHSINQELGADSCGVKLMELAGVKNLDKIIDDYADHTSKKKSNDKKGKDQPSNYFQLFETVFNAEDTHPKSQERIDNLKRHLHQIKNKKRS